MLALALAAAIGMAAATEPAQPPALSTLQVQILAESTEPVDHMRLARHFAALAASYEARAFRYESFAKGVAGNPNRWWSTEPGVTWAQLATDARASAVTTRALTMHHAWLAFGLPSTAPPGAGRFHGGEGALEPTEPELRALAAAARTPAEHHRLEEYYMVVAAREDETANRHLAFAQGFRATPRRTGSGDSAFFHDRRVTEARAAQERALSYASIHRQLAYIGN